jgi:hypothetical protein
MEERQAGRERRISITCCLKIEDTGENEREGVLKGRCLKIEDTEESGCFDHDCNEQKRIFEQSSRALPTSRPGVQGAHPG